MFTYRQPGVQVLYAPLDGVAIIYLLSREAGDMAACASEEVVARPGGPSFRGRPHGHLPGRELGGFREAGRR